MTSRAERLSSRTAEIDKILADYSIPPLPSLETQVSLLDGRIKPFSLEKVMQLEAREIMRQSLSMMGARGAATISKKKHGRERPRSEIRAIREDYKGMKRILELDGPGEVLAAIALNPGREAKWTSSGLTGEDWTDPPEEECLWWKWVYAEWPKGVDMKRFLSDKRKGNILHATFLMRFRQNKGLISQDKFDRFRAEVSPLVREEDKELIPLLRDIADKFPTPFSNGQKRILQLS